MSNTLSFDGKTVFVMGGTSGINLGIAEAFAECGAAVYVASRSQDKVDAAVARLAAYGGRAGGFSADVRDVEALQAGFDSIAAEMGKVDVLVIGQAGNFPAPILGLSPKGFKSVVDIDLLGTYNVVRTAHPYLAQGGASIITISAPQAFVPMENQAHVCAAKAGVEMLTRVMAMEFGPAQIRVNAIVPGPIRDTEGMARLAPTPELMEQTRESVPLKRLGTVREIGDCAMFLASPLAAYISGAIIPVDGGWSLSGAGTLSGSLAQLGAQQHR